MKRTFKEFQDQWEQAANSVGGGGVSMPADAVHDKKKKKKDIYDGRTKAGRKFIERILSRRKASEVKEDYNQDLALATKNVARLAKKETGQDQKDYMAVSRALAQGNLGAVKKVIKGISTQEIQADILNILVGYNDLIAKMYPKAVDSKGRLKSGMSVGKMIKEVTEAVSKYDFRYYRTNELELKNRAYGRDVEAAFKKAGYDVYGGDLSVRGTTIKFNRYSKHWGTNEKKLKAVIKKVLGIDVDRL